MSKYQRSVRDMLNDSFPLSYISSVKILSVFVIYRISHLKCHLNAIVVVCDKCHV